MKIQNDKPYIISLKACNNNLRTLPTKTEENKPENIEENKEENKEEEQPQIETETPQKDKKVITPIYAFLKKIRCRNWPSCPSGDSCEYAHPTEIVRQFYRNFLVQSISTLQIWKQVSLHSSSSNVNIEKT